MVLEKTGNDDNLIQAMKSELENALRREKEATQELSKAKADSPKGEGQGNKMGGLTGGIHTMPRDSQGETDDRFTVKQRNALHGGISRP